MSFTVYNPVTIKPYRTCKTALAAASSAAALRKKGKDAVFTTTEFYNESLNTLVETTNLQSGKTVMIRRSEVGGCCDPGTETYWSM